MRIQGWEKRLFDFIASRENAPFVWGEHDCVMFAADCVLAVTGRDVAAAVRGTYSDEAGAARIIARAGGFRALVSRYLMDEINTRFAQRGDVVMIDRGEDSGVPCLAVCVGAHVVAAGQDGLVKRCLTESIAAWRVN